MHDEARLIRERHADLVDAVDRLEQAGCPAETMVAQTTTVSVYPTAAAAYYAVVPVQVGGSEAEGSSASLSPDSTRVFYAFNLGSTVPPAGSTVLCHSASGRWNFRWDS